MLTNYIEGGPLIFTKVKILLGHINTTTRNDDNCTTSDVES